MPSGCSFALIVKSDVRSVPLTLTNVPYELGKSVRYNSNPAITSFGLLNEMPKFVDSPAMTSASPTDKILSPVGPPSSAPSSETSVLP